MGFIKEDLIKSLRNGTTPESGFSEIVVGVENIRDQIHKQLDYVSEGKCDGKFIAGDYGSGKTFLCRTLFQDALDRGFVCTEVVISPDVQLNHLKDFYSELVSGFRTKKVQEGSALTDIVEKWLYKLQEKAQALAEESEGKVTRDVIAKKLEEQIEDELNSIKTFNNSIANVIRTFMKARHNLDRERASDAIAWLRGDENLAYQKKKKIGVRGELEAEEVFNALKSLLNIIRQAGYEGLFVILDEIETVQRLHTKNQRKNAYETLRKIVDNFGTSELPGAFFLGTGTQELFDESNQKGVASYEALSDRLTRTGEIDTTDSHSRQLIDTLHGLEKKGLEEAAKKVRKIHGEVYDWTPEEVVSNEFITKFTKDYVTSFGEEYEQKPRRFLKSFVELLDHVEDGKKPEEIISE